MGDLAISLEEPGKFEFDLDKLGGVSGDSDVLIELDDHHVFEVLGGARYAEGQGGGAACHFGGTHEAATSV